MGRKTELILKNVRLGKLIHGGQTIADAPDGRKLLVWGGLPGELVNVKVIKKKKSFYEGITTGVLEKSDQRIKPREPKSYLSTSPWQIMTYDLENQAKSEILEEAFNREKVTNIQFDSFVSKKQRYGYRNKQEFGFWGDEKGLHLAHYVRGTHGKQKIDGSILANDVINEAARAVRDELNRLKVWGGTLKTLALRCSADSNVVGALFVKEKVDLGKFQLPKVLNGLDVYFSNPKSPASIPTRKLYAFGDIKLMDNVLGVNITYDVLSFFQVNLPVFKKVLKKIKDYTSKQSVIDLYSGVGTIGLCIERTTKLIESESNNIMYAKQNTKNTNVEVIMAAAEEALAHIDPESTIIVDPPRAGLNKKLISRLLESRPPRIIYLSCNLATQARDVALLAGSYNVVYAQGFNFFPATPHIESLVVLDRN